MRAFAKIAIAAAFVSAVVWFGRCRLVTRIDSAVEFQFRLLPRW